MHADDPRLKVEPYLSAPYIHQNNEPKYHAMLLRAVEHAKHGGARPRHILWIVRQDVPHNPKEIAISPDKLQKKRERFLQYHDQKTAGIPGLLPMYLYGRYRVTERIARGKNVNILKHTPCSIIAWELDVKDRRQTGECERLLHYLPLCIYLKFHGATCDGFVPGRQRQFVEMRMEARIEPIVAGLRQQLEDW